MVSRLRALPFFAALLLVALNTSQVGAQGASLTGSPCKKINQIVHSKNYIYKCLKRGKSLQWSLVGKEKTPSIQPTASPTPTSSSTPVPSIPPTPTPTPLPTHTSGASSSPTPQPSPTASVATPRPSQSAQPSPSPTSSIVGTGLPAARLLSPSSGLLGLVDVTNLSAGWSQYYGKGLAYKHGFVAAGSSFTLKWHVVDAQGKPLPKHSVTLQANKAYGSNTASFKYNCTSITDAGDKDGLDIPALTDDFGDVTFTFIDSSVASEKASTSVKTADTNKPAIYGQFSLQVDQLADLAQTKEIIEIHVLASSLNQNNSSTCTGTPTPSPTPTPTTIANSATWVQEFNDAAGTPPDSTYWTPLIGDGSQIGLYHYGTGEIDNKVADAALQDGSGNLVITATKTNGTWSSARIWTQGKVNFLYGKIEARIKMPTGRGPFPAFWMLGANYMPPAPPPNSNFGDTQWPMSGEVDIAEVLGGSTTTSQGTLHGNNPGTTSDWNGGAGFTSFTPNNFDLTADYHTYGVIWSPSEITFTFDGVPYKTNLKSTITAQTGGVWPFDQPFFLILDCAINPAILDPNLTSTKMYIDWIRVSGVNG